tara:strand:- start:219 stop:488 length:270 start_codon:yes stop_codon:yes gene_type:complete
MAESITNNVVQPDIVDGKESAVTYSYEAARWYLYPSLCTQLLALYENRNGNSAALTSCDKTITDVNALVPVDESKTYTQAEVDAIKAKL